MESEVRNWRESDLTKKEYCRQQGIKLSTFGYWVTRSNASKRNGFLPLLPGTEVQASLIEIIYPNGVRLKAPASDLKTIFQLISFC